MSSSELLSPAFSRWEEFLGFLENKGLFHMDLGLDRVRDALQALGLSRPPFVVVQVVGTNGKGSTSTFLAHLARAHGLRVGLHTSPHLVSVRERITIQGRMLSEGAWFDAANALVLAAGTKLTYFEMVTCLAVLLFARENVDVAIMETGLGGKHDATTALAADLVLFTPIDLDHTALLGTTREAIATDKAGAMRVGVPVLSVEQPASVAHIFADVSRELHAPLVFCSPALTGRPATTYSADDSGDGVAHASIQWPGSPVDLPPLGLAGSHQYTNASLALAGFRVVRELLHAGKGHAERAVTLPFRKTAAELAALVAVAEQGAGAGAGLAEAHFAGRMQFVGPVPSSALTFAAGEHGLPPMILDGAHNPHGLAALGLSLAQQGIAPLATIFSCLADKDTEALVMLVRSLSPGAIFVPPISGNPRAMGSEELAHKIGLNAFACASLEEALNRASAHMYERMPEVFTQNKSHNPLLVCGSFYLLGGLFSLIPSLFPSSEASACEICAK